MPDSPLRDFIYLDFDRVRSLAAQLGIHAAASSGADRIDRERLCLQIEPALLARGGLTRIWPDFDFARWTENAFSDGQSVLATGTVRLLDYAWLSLALAGLPAVLRKMSKIEMTALRNSEEGRRMSKAQLQQRTVENQAAITKVEEFKADELGDVVRKLYGDIVRVKVRPSPVEPRAVLIGTAYAEHFYDTPAAISQKYGIEIDAGWSVLGQLNMPRLDAPPQPIPTGNQMEDAFEQIALLMNGAFRVANSPVFPALSFTPIAIYRAAK